MATDLILRGPLYLGLTSASTDVSCETTGVTIMGTVADVEIPATLCQGKSHAGGAQKYQIKIDYLATDGSAGTLFPLLWSGILSSTHEVYWQCTLRDGPKGPANPQWSGIFVVPGADLGGEQETLSAGSITATLTDTPVTDAT